MKILKLFLILAAFLMIPLLSHAAQDVKGSKDHPLFTRMPGAHIAIYDEIDFVEQSFRGKTKDVKVEGYKYEFLYKLEKGTSLGNIIRNHTKAIKDIGGEVIFEWASGATMRLAKDGKEVWAEITGSGDRSSKRDAYELTIVEREAFVQQITSTDMLDSINKTGFVAIYINFDTGKSEIKPESMPAIDQIVSLMKSNQALNVSVEGHTDNVGDAASNKALSERRALAVKNAVADKGIAPKRLTHAGRGQEMPVADNRLEEGRAMNRRVELVKQK